MKTTTHTAIAADYIAKLRTYDHGTVTDIFVELAKRSARTRSAETRQACEFMMDCCRIVLAD